MGKIYYILFLYRTIL